MILIHDTDRDALDHAIASSQLDGATVVEQLGSGDISVMFSNGGDAYLLMDRLDDLNVYYRITKD